MNNYDELTQKEAYVLGHFLKNNQCKQDGIFFIKEYYDDLYNKLNFIPQYPVFVSMNLTNCCDLRCKHCSKSLERNASFIDLDLLKKSFYYFENWRIKQVILTGGEPTLHPNFIDIVKLLKKRNISVGILTNGQNSFLTKIDELKKILDENDFIQFSVDDILENYSKIRVNGKFDILNKSIKEVLGEKFSVKTNTVVNSENYMHLHEIYENLKMMGLTNMRFSPMFYIKESFAKQVNDVETIKSFVKIIEVDQSYNFISGIPLSVFYPFVNWFNTKFNETLKVGSFLCPANSTSVEMDAFGNIYPCSYLEGNRWLYGNILDEKFEKNFIRKKQLFSVLSNCDETCRNCKSKSLCKGGCKASSICRYGEIGYGDTNCFYKCREIHEI